MADLCTDNRFEMIEKAKQMLMESTNIETDKAEMAVIDNILFRFWQMGWLDKILYDIKPAVRGEWTKDCLCSAGGGTYSVWRCSECKFSCLDVGMKFKFCPNCGADMRGAENDG